MGESAWQENEIIALNYLEEKLPFTPTSLTADAWLGLGVQ